MDDGRRVAHRRRTLKEGKVILSDWTGIDCVIRDLSDTGARLEFGGPTELPQTFRILVTSSNQLIPVELAWQRGLSVGVHFTGPGRDAPPRKF
jgi:hypothetical protein